MLKHADFLITVQRYISANPECAAYISDFVAKGIEEARKADRDRALDMEVALSVALASRFRKRNGLILDKLKKWEGKAFLNWSSIIKEIEHNVEKANGQG